MKSRRVIVGVGGCVVAGILGVALWPGEREPGYQGKKLSEWLVLRGAVLPDGPEAKIADRAILAIGTNAVPFLLGWVRYERPAWKDWLEAAYKRFPDALQSATIRDKLSHGKSEVRHSVAFYGFFCWGRMRPLRLLGWFRTCAVGCKGKRMLRTCCYA